MITLDELRRTEEPVAWDDIEVLLDSLGYQFSHDYEGCAFWEITSPCKLSFSMDARDARDDMFPANLARNMGEHLARHQRIIQKGLEGPGMATQRE
jgi:hypothetical protein